MHSGALALTLLAVLAAPSDAGAAAVSMAYEPPIPGIEPNPAYALSVRAESGEVNLLTVGRDATGYTVRDAAHALTAGSGCRQADANEVHCAASESNASHSVFVDAGDGADYVGVGPLPPNAAVELRGGRGADYVVGGVGPDTLFGGTGSDHINGLGGDDTIDGGAGTDSMAGRLGDDRLSYERRRAPVRVDLRRGTGISGDERDRFAGFEEVAGGRARDVLAGDAGPNLLLGGPTHARDRVSGRRGDDVLVGYRVNGGAGDDAIDSHTASCGRGADRLTRVIFKPVGPFRADCEAIVAGAFLELTPDPVRLTHTVAVYRLRCVAAIGRCAGTLELRDAGGPLGQAHFSRPDASAAEPIRLRIPLRRPSAGPLGTVRLSAHPAYRRDRFRTRLR